MATRLHIRFEDLGKQFYDRWLFRGINYDLQAHRRLAIIGDNGSGKSTLLRIIAGQLSPTEGRIAYTLDGKSLSVRHLYQHIAWAAPYLEGYPDLDLLAALKLHFRFKANRLADERAVAKALNLEDQLRKPLRHFSSGMMQRLKVGMALFSQCELLLLDEPTSNLDEGNVEMMLDLINTHQGDRLLVLASNMPREYTGFSQFLKLSVPE